jgi:hypothetical protein
MRILANYSCKSGENTYCVTFESLGDISRGSAEIEADDLFRMAKEAVQRQINSQPKAAVCCKCNEPITPRQKHLIIKLARERGQFIELEGMTNHQASDLIERLIANVI